MFDRREALKLLASAPLAAGFAWTEAEAAEAHGHVQATGRGGTARRSSRSSSPPTSMRPCAADRHHHAARRSVGQRNRCRRAGVHGFHDARSARRGRRRCAAVWPGSIRECRTAVRHDVSSAAPTPSAPRCSTTSPGRRRPPAPHVPRRRILFELPRSHRDRVLDEQDRHRRPSISRQHVRGGVDRLSDEAMEKLGVSQPAD